MKTAHPAIRIPRRFKPTHETAGLPGYPAIDVFGRHDQVVLLDDAGTVSRISGRSPCQRCTSGGACGWSLYIDATDGSRWFLTHFGALFVRVGSRVTPQLILGSPLDVRDAPGWSVEHIHAGRRAP